MKSSLSLFVIAEDYRAAAEALANMELDEQTLADTLEGLSGELEVKAANVAMFVRNLEATAEAIKTAEKQMADRRKALESRASRVRTYIKDSMSRAGITKIDSPYFSLAIKNNPASVVIDDEGVIPSEFMRQPEPPPPSPDKKAIGEALKAGSAIDGAHLEQGQRLEIK
jgi:hypothetical protein